jgi:hypothetical protein
MLIMSDKDDKIVEQSSGIDNNQNIVDAAPANIAAQEAVPKNEASESDVSKVKIRTILKQRFKSMRPGLKKALPLILVGIICFAAGIGVDRAFIGRRVNKALKNRPGINQAMPKNNNNKQGNMKNNQNTRDKSTNRAQ